jgi:hypothetical protein
MLKDAYYQPINIKSFTHSKSSIALDSVEELDGEGYCSYSGISLVDPKVISAILCNYTILKRGSKYTIDGDLWYLLHDFDNLLPRALEDYPLYAKIVEMKIENFQNAEI